MKMCTGRIRAGGWDGVSASCRRLSGTTLVSACCLLWMSTAGSPAQGAALGLREMGTPLNGTASAGWAALGEDASTAATNPAAMTRFRQSEFLVGPQVLVVDIKFDTEQSSFGGGDGGNAGGVVPAGGLFYVHKVCNDWVKSIQIWRLDSLLLPTWGSVSSLMMTGQDAILLRKANWSPWPPGLLSVTG